jgi:hypothetical protein
MLLLDNTYLKPLFLLDYILLYFLYLYFIIYLYLYLYLYLYVIFDYYYYVISVIFLIFIFSNLFQVILSLILISCYIDELIYVQQPIKYNKNIYITKKLMFS